MKMKMDNRSHKNKKNRPRPRHERRSTKYKKCLSVTMLACIKQHLSSV